MIVVKTLTFQNPYYNDLKTIKELVYDKCGFELTNLKQNLESKEYSACSFLLNDFKIQFRVSKITPTKVGQFVTIWKRNKEGITQPFEASDDIDFVIITTKTTENYGQFIFPKSVLIAKGVITKEEKVGKRGIRLYPPWDITTNKQAQKTQVWQSKYFLTIKKNIPLDLEFAKQLFKNTN